MTEFYQDGPSLGNQYVADAALRAYLEWKLPAPVLVEIEPGLRRLGDRAVTDILAAGDAAEAEPPRHVPYDAWGRRVDRIETSAGWRTLDRIAAEEGIVATGYERRQGPWSRLVQFARLYLFAPSSATYSCPLAMTDGAARCLEVYAEAELRDRVLPRLTSRDPATVWTSGQWMTERTGGSDVSLTSTVARCVDGQFRLYGTKWFTSATTAQVAMTLARIDDRLSLFYVELRDPAGALQGIRVNRLKDKLGTRALPTAELTLDGTPATLVGGEGHGVRKIAALFNITRIYNAAAAVAGMRRAVHLARAYAVRRIAFGRPLVDHALHVETLASLEVECDAALHLVGFLAELLGKDECGVATPAEQALLRLLTPVVKLYTAKQAIAVASETLEAFGGAGYIEDTGLPRLLRDAQVLSIWEGTTNVLSLDTLRAVDRDAALAPALADLRHRLAGIETPALAESRACVRAALDVIEHMLPTSDPDARQAGARAFAFALARSAAAVVLLEHAASAPSHERTLVVATRWCAAPLVPTAETDARHRQASRHLLGS
jgi:putative acyl-CoA dehydrogenase